MKNFSFFAGAFLALVIGFCAVVNAESYVTTKTRYNLENNKITFYTEFSNYETGEEIVYVIKDLQGEEICFNQLIYGGSPITQEYSVPDSQINGGIIGINSNAGYIEKGISFSEPSKVSFNLANGTYAICTAENGRIKTFNSGEFKLCEGEKVTIKLEGNGETNLISSKVNDELCDDD